MTQVSVNGSIMTITIDLQKLAWAGTKSGVSQKGVDEKVTLQHGGYEYAIYPTVYRMNASEAEKAKPAKIKTSKAADPAPAQMDIQEMIQAEVAKAFAAMQAQTPAPKSKSKRA